MAVSSVARRALALLYRLTLPGVMMHELAHQFVAALFDLEVREVDYTSHVEHEAPKTLTQGVLVSFAPLFVNTAFGVAALSTTVGRVPFAVRALRPTLGHAAGLYLAFALFFRAVPSVQDLGNVFGVARRRMGLASPHVVALVVVLSPVLVPGYVALWVAKATDTRFLVDLGYATLALAATAGLLAPLVAAVTGLLPAGILGSAAAIVPLDVSFVAVPLDVSFVAVPLDVSFVAVPLDASFVAV